MKCGRRDRYRDGLALGARIQVGTFMRICTRLAVKVFSVASDRPVACTDVDVEVGW